MTPWSDVTCQLEPVALPYCTDQPSSDTGLLVVLNNSMKSFFSGAPLLPPPPYTWLMTTAASGMGAETVMVTVAVWVLAPATAVAVRVTGAVLADTPVALPDASTDTAASLDAQVIVAPLTG